MRSGQYEKSMAGWQDYLEKFPDAKTADVARRFIQINRGLIFERDAEQAKARSETLEGQAAREAAEEAERLEEAATKVWRQLAEEREEPFALARIKRQKALDYWNNGRYQEAVAILDMARWECNEFWNEASDMIIAIKQEAGLPLTLSEKLAVQRREDAEAARERRRQQERG